jgi:hypothetical protein
MTENDVQNLIFNFIVLEQRALAIRVNSGAITVPATRRHKRRFFAFASWRAIGWALSRAGVSDILACIRGRFWAIEVKAPGKINNVTDHQASFLAAVKQCGGVAVVVDSLEKFQEAINGH